MVLSTCGRLPRRRSAPPATYHRDVVPNHEPAALTARSVIRQPTLVPAAMSRHDPELVEAILDAIVEAIIVLDPASGRIVDVNRGAEVLFARERDAMIGLTLADLVRPPEARRLTGFIDQIAAGRREAATVMTEVVPAGRPPMSVEVVLQPLATNGTSWIVAIARDVTDRIEVQVRLQRLAQSEHARAAELNAVIRAMGEAVVVCGVDGRIVLANPAAERLFPEILSQTYRDVVGLLDDPGRVAPSLGARAGPIELAVAAEPDRWLELTTYPVTVGVGLAAAGEETILVIRDVTDARRREAIRETFIGVLSHELRTPVTTIFGGAKLLAREHSTLDEDTRRGIFRDIYDEAERLQRLVEDVVALNRFSDEDGEIGWEPVLLQRVVPTVARSEESRWPGVSFVVDIASGLPTVVADPTYVEQVIRNLLSNAAKYGGAGSTVTVTAETGDGEVTVRVMDDGPGFPAAEASRLFELFYRAPGTAASASGAGIGLFVCARLIQAMGGRIWAMPRPEGGAEFGFALRELDE
jgi:PAS domain S-box-containing protein